MLVFLPAGFLGLVVASLAAAYMSTISTHLNWGASYVVDDAYRRFVAPHRTEAHYVGVGRAVTVLLIVLSSVLALWLTNAYQAFQILLQIGAGTGLVFILRWYWWRVNAWSEIAAMAISFAVALATQLWLDWDPTVELVVGVVATTAGWIAVTLATPPTAPDTLASFVRAIRPPGPGWDRVRRSMDDVPTSPSDPLAPAAGAWFLGCATVYLTLFGTGYLLYGSLGWGLVCLGGAAAAAVGLARLLPAISLVE
jgi:Na+/proline symporter